MPKFLVERDMPNLGNRSFEETQDIARKAADAIETAGSNVCWVQTYITDNKAFTIMSAPNENVIRDHAKKAGLPITNIYPVRLVLDDTFAEIGKRTQYKPSGSRG